MASLGREFTPQVFSGVMVNCMPMANTVYIKVTSKMGDATCNCVRPTAANTMPKPPTSTGMRTPCLSNRRPAKNPTMAPIKAPGRSAMPLTVALMPSVP